MKKNYLLISSLLIVVVGAFFIFNTGKVEGTQITIYKSPNCGCCVGHAAELERNGFDVQIIPTYDMEFIKTKHQIPSEMESCHTSIIGDYFVEGHVPIKAINKLLEENPDIDGISLPRMPSGTPGMPGVKKGEWVIYSLSNGKYSEFMRI